MKKVHVPLGQDSYDVYIENGLLNKADQYLDSNKEYVVFTDSNIPKEYISSVTSKITCKKVFTFTPGESLKKAENAIQVIEEMIALELPRSITLIAIGGGVIGDFTGFVASIYMRGVDFIQIPTSLLAQVDSSVGGKVGVNSKLMKNAIGSFHQPKLVLIDPTVLKTLEKRHFNNGMAELIKHGIIKGKSLFKDILEKDIEENIDDFIYQSISIKRDVVIQDVTDKGIRQILNFGHTIGHAIEQDSKYELLHGESIAIGMSIIAKEQDYYDDLIKVFHKFSLPTSYDYNREELFAFMKTDKKVRKDTLDMIFVEEVGNAFVKRIKLDDMKGYL
jgi:3-dehydroquinate synthase